MLSLVSKVDHRMAPKIGGLTQVTEMAADSLAREQLLLNSQHSNLSQGESLVSRLVIQHSDDSGQTTGRLVRAVRN